MSVSYDEFEEYIQKVADRFKSLRIEKPVRLISHLDADGITSASIMVKMLNRLGVKYKLSTFPQLNEKFMFDLRSEKYSYYIFTDLGSGLLPEIVSHFHVKNCNVFILDHHRIKGEYTREELESANIFHVNPHDFGIDGATEISGSGLAFLFAKAFDADNVDQAHLAVIGAIGDVQEKKGFSEINKKILDLAIKNNLMQLVETINFFGMQTKSILRLMESNTNLVIPSVSGNRIRALAFLNSININPNKKYYELNNDELKRLSEKIIEFRKEYFMENPEKIYATEYVLLDEEDGTVFRDAREYSTLLNACGRLGQAEIGIGSCLKDHEARTVALESLRSYKFEIVNALTWYDNYKEDSEDIKITPEYILINAKDNISSTIIGTLASILSKTKLIGLSKYVLTMARNEDNTTKISVRYSGKTPKQNLRDLLNTITEKIGGESGGHDFAAGAIIETVKEQEFIDSFIKEVSN
ncbi:DHH family phosphoesterase [Candidatus Woesearchaeota archaeon]|nr:DHH family phosphoesterase [Candidatus Woesearchaeota archaeon]